MRTSMNAIWQSLLDIWVNMSKNKNKKFENRKHLRYDRIGGIYL